jgi:type IV pilus assembly protein PilP
MSRKSLLTVVMAMAFPTLLFGCGERSPEPVQAPSPQRVVVPQPKSEAPAAVTETAVESAPPPYVYSCTGRRDPFEALLIIKKSVSRMAEPLTPLQKFEVGQLRLIGVIVGKGGPRAMVVAPDGKSYILGKGVKVGKNDGTVVQIKEEAVYVEERFYDFSGKVRESITKIQLPKREGVE